MSSTLEFNLLTTKLTNDINIVTSSNVNVEPSNTVRANITFAALTTTEKKVGNK